MKQTSWIFAPGVLVALGIGSLVWGKDVPEGPMVRKVAEPSAQELSQNDPLSMRGMSTEIDRLKAEVRRKDQELALQRSSAFLAEHVRLAREEARENEAAMLDERMFVDVDERKARRLTLSMESVLDDIFPSELQREVICGTGMCRVTLAGEQRALGARLEELIDRSGKDFGASTIQQTEDGQTRIYFADDAKQLETARKSDTEEPPEIMYEEGEPPARRAAIPEPEVQEKSAKDESALAP